jgi:hypothetical protein
MTTANDKIQALSEKETEKLLGKEVFRARTKEIICEHLESVDFMKKVREYAAMEIESRIFNSAKYWITLVLTAILTSGIGVIITLYTKK